MRTQLSTALKVSALAVILSFGMSYAFAWTAPTATPPNGNVSFSLGIATSTFINTSGTAQVKAGDFMVKNLTASSTVVNGTLTVLGDVKVGNQNSACGSGTAGLMHYNSTLNMMEFCDGILWQTISKIHPPIGTMNIFTGTGLNPSGIAFDNSGNMWTANSGGNSVTKINTFSGSMITYSGTGLTPSGIAFDGTNMWTANYGDSSVTKISPTGAMTTYTGTGVYPRGIAFDGTNMWTANGTFLFSTTGGTVTKVTPTGVMTTYSIVTPAIGIAFDGTNMWTANGPGNSVSKISPSGVVTTYTGTGTYPYGITYDGAGNMWTANWGYSVDSDSVTKISTSNGAMTTYSGVGLNPIGIASAGDGSVWTTNWGRSYYTPLVIGNSVSRISPTGGITTYTGTASYPTGIAFDGTNMWVTSYYDGSNATQGTKITKIQAMP